MDQAKYFNSIAADWNEIRKKYFSEELKNCIFQKVDAEGKICADLGCGTGFISVPLSHIAKVVFSVDISLNMLKELNKAAVKEGIKNIYPLKGYMDKLPLFNQSIDVVIINMALHHVENPLDAIREMYRILRKGGTVVISDAEEHNGKWAREEMHDVWLGFSHAQIIAWMKQAGFTGVEIGSTGLKCSAYSSKGEYTETGIFIAKGIKMGE
ncbi:MAG: class I SAM-dependent methyltransferase [Clostridiales bacterium]|nr:class I SAM-dependent methyltransferase [Clostridiales bacterium]